MLIETVGQLKELLNAFNDDARILIDDADEGTLLEITQLETEKDVVVIGGDYKHRVDGIR